MRHTVTVETSIKRTFRVEQVAGMFDLKLDAKSRESFGVDLPELAEGWQIGAIVGPSGSGKTSIARHVYGDAFARRAEWPRDRAVVEGFGDLPVKIITATLSAVGFSSPPAWVKPFHVLSNGEQFRCELAHALLCGGELIVFDEFTSVVDRTVAQIGSAAVAKAIRKGHVARRFVAVSCHYDILDWLEPDWCLDMATQRLVRGHLWRRPPISLEVFRCTCEAWPMFARHHYLSHDLNRGALCYLAVWRERPVAFCATLPAFGKVNWRRISRLVTLPDYQGIGIGGRLLDTVAELLRMEGKRVTITTAHPAMIHRLNRSPLWRCREVAKRGFAPLGLVHDQHATAAWKTTASTGRSVVSFELVGEREGAAAPEEGTGSRRETAGPERERAQSGGCSRAPRRRARARSGSRRRTRPRASSAGSPPRRPRRARHR